MHSTARLFDIIPSIQKLQKHEICKHQGKRNDDDDVKRRVQSQFRLQAGGTAAARHRHRTSRGHSVNCPPLPPPPLPPPTPLPTPVTSTLKAEQSLVRDLYTVQYFCTCNFWCECRDVQRPPPRKLRSSDRAVWLSSVKGSGVGESWSVFVSVLVI